MRYLFEKLLMLSVIAALAIGGLYMVKNQRTHSNKAKGKYAYSTLKEEEKSVYNQILETILNYEERVITTTNDPKIVEKVFENVMADFGEIYWVKGYQYRMYSIANKTMQLEFRPSYSMTKEEKKQFDKELNAIMKPILAEGKRRDSDYEKVKYYYEWIIKETNYNSEATHNQNILSVFLNHSSVCKGYATALQYLLSKSKIESIVVTGTANGQGHAWNLVKMDGDYYYVDPTWGDLQFSNEEGREGISYNYFGITSNQLLRTHKPDEFVKLPECVAIQDNYFQKEDRYVDAWDIDNIGRKLAGIDENNVNNVSLQFSNLVLMQRAKKYFIEEGHLRGYTDINNRIIYTEDVKQNILMIFKEE